MASYWPPSTIASGWHVETSQETGEVIPYFIGECKTPRPLASPSAIGEASAPVETLFMYLRLLESEHRHWPPIQTPPIELVREVVDKMMKKEEDDVRLNEID